MELDYYLITIIANDEVIKGKVYENGYWAILDKQDRPVFQNQNLFSYLGMNEEFTLKVEGKS